MRGIVVRGFTVDDFNLIDELLVISRSISNLFNILCDLEINEREDSPEYKRNLDYLQIALSVEEDIYQNSSLDVEKCHEIIDFIMPMLPMNEKGNLDCLPFLENDNRAVRRIINALKKKIMVDYDIDIAHGENNFEGMSDEYLKDIVQVSNIMYAYIFEDLINAIIIYNEEEIEKKENSDYRECLIKQKYFLSYIYKDCNEKSVDSSFAFDKRTPNITKFMAFAFNLSDDSLANIKKDNLSLLAGIQICEILNTKENAELLIRKSILRALFLLMDDDALCDIDDLFVQAIKDSGNVFNKENIKLIENCFINTHSDKDKQLTLKIS